MGFDNSAEIRVNVVTTGDEKLDRISAAVKTLGEGTRFTAQELSVFEKAMDLSTQSGDRWDRSLKNIEQSSKSLGTGVAGVAREIRDLIKEQDKAADSVQRMGRTMDAAHAENLRRSAESVNATQRMGKMMEAAHAENAKREVAAIKAGVTEQKAALQELRSFTGAAGFSLPGIPTGMGGSALGAALIPVAASAGIILATRSMYDMVKAAGEGERELSNFAARLGLTIDQAEKLSITAKLTGLNISALEQSARLLSGALEDPTGAGRKQADALNAIGISTLHLSGQQKELGDVTLEVIDHLSKIPDVATRVHESQLLLGRGSKVLQPMIEDLPRLQKAAEELAASLGTGTNAELLKADDSIKQMTASWEIFKKNLAAKIAPIIIPIVASVSQTLQRPQPNRDLPGDMRESDRIAQERGDGFVPLIRARLQGMFGPDTTQLVTGINRDITNVAAGDAMGKKIQAEYDQTRDGLEKQISLHKAAADKAREEASQTGATVQFKIDKQKEMNKELGLEAEARAKLKAMTAKDKTDTLPGMLAHFADVDVSPEQRLRNLYFEDERKLQNPTAQRKFQLADAYNKAAAREKNKEDAKNAEKDSEDQQRLRESFGKHIAEENKQVLAELNLTDFSKPPSGGRPPGPSLNRQLKELQDSQNFQVRAAGLAAGPGGDSASAALQKELSIRQRIAGLEKDIEMDKAKGHLLENDRINAEFEAQAAYEDKLKHIREENTLHQMELDKKRQEQFSSAFAGGIMALQHGPEALRTFFVGQAQNLERQVLTNAGGMLYKAAGGDSAGRLPESIVGTTAKPTLIGRLLEGTGFGAAAKTPDIVATDENTVATKANTTALAAIAAGLGVSVPGGLVPGGLVPTGGIMSGASGPMGMIFHALSGGGSTAPLSFGGFDGTSAPAAGSGDSVPLSFFGGATKPSALQNFTAGAGSVVSGKAIQTIFTGKDAQGNQVGGAQMAGAAIGLAGAAYSGVSAAVHDFKVGGAKGITAGIGDIAGTAAAFDPEPISHAVLAGVALAAKVVSSLFGDPKADRAASIQHELTNSAYSTKGYFDEKGNFVAGRENKSIGYFGASGGDSFDYNFKGGIRSGSAAETSRNTFDPSPNANQQKSAPVQIIVQTMDSKSFLDHASDISSAVRKGIQMGHPLVAELQQTLMP